jgi:two-component system chemotaxis response regulator CheB
MFVVLHTSPESLGILDQILSRAGSVAAITPTDKQRIEPNQIYVAPPDHHMLLDPGIIRLTRGPKENRFRPAIDPLFRSAAQTYGPCVIGVILTGGLDDGTAGLWAVKQLGGVAVVQDPSEALASSMPLSAIRHVNVDHILPLAEIAPLLVGLTLESTEKEGVYDVPEEIEIEVGIAKEQSAIETGVFKLGGPSNLACPECHGVLLQLQEGDRTRFRCHTGHAYSAESLLADIKEKIGETLWSAVRAIEEEVILMRHMATHLTESENGNSAERFLKKAHQAQQRAETVRQTALAHEEVIGEKPQVG